MAYKGFDLTGKTALITGGNSGIGLGMAEALAQAGAAVCIWGTNAGKNEAALKKIQSTGAKAIALQCDVGDEAEVENRFAETVAALGPLHACFANAGVSGRANLKSFADMEAAEWKRVTRVNLDGAFYTLRAAAKHMVGHGKGGALVGTASLAAISGQPRGEHYAATKGGLISMIRALAVEFARYGVRANAILPGWIDTAMTEKALNWDKFRDKVLPRVPMRRWGKPEDFGAIAVYLVSDASSYHTGDTFLIDGGYSLFLMKYRRFGRTGLQVSEVVVGAGYVGGIIVLADDDTRRRVLRRALDAGINWIDTAPGYGQGRSEEALGWLLPEVPEKPYLSTKVRLDLAKLADIPGEIERSLHASLRRLKRDSVDLLQLHNHIAGERSGSGIVAAVSVEDVLRKDGVAEGLERMREQGLTRFIGLTALGEAPAIVRALDSKRFDSAQVYYNLLNPSAARAMPAGWRGHDFAGIGAACARNDVAMMNIRVFASGVLATDERHGREIALTENSALEVEAQRARAALAALGPGHGTRAQTALRFVLANASFACHVVGLGEPSHLDEVIEAEAKGPLPAAVIARLEAAYASGFAS